MIPSVSIHQFSLPFDDAHRAEQDVGFGVQIVTATRLARLFDDFADRVEKDPLPPYEAEVVCLPHGSGLRSWLEQSLALRLGCAASLHTPTIRELADALIRRIPEIAGDAPDRAIITWQLFGFLTALPADRRFDPVRSYLDRTGGEAMPLAQRLARLYESYQVLRLDILNAWRDGKNPVADWEPSRWQAPLWRTLGQTRSADRATQVEQLLELLRGTGNAIDGIPRRVSIFGEQVIPPLYLEFLYTLSAHCEITWYAAVPGPADSDNVLSAVLAQESTVARQLWKAHLPAARIRRISSEEGDGVAAQGSALGILQEDIRMGRRRHADDRLPLSASDDSLRIHSCHAPMRELEVLRDQLLDAFESIPGLQPSDVLIVVSDLDRYAALVDAVFSSGDDATRIEYRIARDPRSDGQRYLRAFLASLELLTSRLTAGGVLELLSESPVLTAAGLTADDVDVIRGWLRETHVRWGADARHREEFGLPPGHRHTWRHGLDRLLMGLVAGGRDGVVDGVLPYAEETLDRADVLGRFALWMQDLQHEMSVARRPYSLEDWAGWLRHLVHRFLEPRSDDEEKAEDYLLRQIRDLGQMQAYIGDGRTVDFPEVRRYLRGVLDHYEGAGQVLSGAVTVTDFQRLPFVPARVMACVGLNDDLFPGRAPSAEFDLLVAEERPGDPDDRRTDKQRFLDALLAAQERVILTFTGRSQKDNSERAPSVVLDALLEALLQTFTSGDGDAEDDAARVRRHFLIEHPLQPFSPRYFDGSDDRLFSFDRRNCIPPLDERLSVPPFVRDALPDAEVADDRTIALRDLIKAWSNPSEFFCNRLGIRLRLEDVDVADIEPQYLDSLEQYRVRQTILEGILSGDSEAHVHERLRLEGALPDGALGEATWVCLRREVDTVLQVVQAFGERDTMEIDLDVRGWRVVGDIEHVAGDRALRFRSSKLTDKDVAEAWVAHLALTASGRAAETYVIGRDKQVKLAVPDDPLGLLAPLVEQYADIMRRPLPLFPSASPGFARHADQKKALSAYVGSEWTRGDCADPYITLAYRHHNPVEADPDFAREAAMFWHPVQQHLLDV